jgi:hypothetical protein
MWPGFLPVQHNLKGRDRKYLFYASGACNFFDKSTSAMEYTNEMLVSKLNLANDFSSLFIYLA